ncbi:MAG: 1-deoxy-D-xylulose-5-phosphate reductoisomerase [Thermodesulfobacteriota bacterium]|nr:1-deoxy-D-xylulose-5-phosphate reductoisomerase [Thermodesulfobacteriota bacterium]
MKKLSILGSTGSIGVNALDIVAKHPDKFQVVALAGGGNMEKMEEQIKRFRPELVALMEPESVRRLKSSLPGSKTRILSGMEGLMAVAIHPEAEMVLSALAGSVGLLPTLAAVRARKTLAIANKEPLVMAGEILQQEARDWGVCILPVDSEHSAIFQALAGHRKEDIKRLILTASGGPFLHTPVEELAKVTPEQALNHPQWRMGKKVTIDSASLMNKGLEVIEAHWLFGVPAPQIEVLIHPQSIVHSMVEYIDGSVVAQMSIPDMRGPIAYALAYPERLDIKLPSLNLFEIGKLTFSPVDPERFPALGLAYQALKEGGTMPAVLNAANEVAVEAFLQGRLGFSQISQLIRQTMARHKPIEQRSLENILQAHAWAKREAQKMIDRGAL